MKNDSVNVLIAGVGGGSVGLEIMKALRMSDIPYCICAVDMAERSLGLFMADKSYIVPPASSDEYVPAILDICMGQEIQVLISGSEPDLKALSNNREIFEEKGVFLPFNSRDVVDLCTNKKQTCAFLQSKGIPLPKTLAVDCEGDLSAVDFFPVIIKPYKGGCGSRNTFITQDREELVFFYRYLLKYGQKPLVQQYIGSYQEEYTVGILSDTQGSFVSSIAIKRDILSCLSNRLKVPSVKDPNELLAVSSGVSQGEVVNDERLLDQCRRIAHAVKSKGPLNIQCRLVDGTVYPFEINPRFSGTTYIRALAGVNEPDLMIRKYVLKESISEKIVPKNGLVLRGLQEFFIAS
jgi:carbamoyl-phosphate synthase large subunit